MRISRLVLTTRILEELQHHAWQERPLECCGFLAGRVEGHTAMTQGYLPLVNERASPTAFRTEAKSVLAAFRRLRAEQIELVGIVHSHPSSSGLPSETDLQENTYGEVIPWMILDQRNQPWVWSLSSTNYAPVELVVDSYGRSVDV